MEKTIKEKGQFQTDNKFKQNKLVIGCTVGSDCTGTNIRALKELGVTQFQIVAKFDRSENYLPPNSLLQNIGECNVIIHMPFYFHFAQKPTEKFRRYFSSLNRYWRECPNITGIIGHCKGIKKIDQLGLLYRNIRIYSKMAPEIKLLLENDAGGKSNPAPTLRNLTSVLRTLGPNINAGLCIDTEHAYAAGDSLFSINFHEHASMIHLNAIPQNVIFGRHLDRHSLTPLSKSKNGTKFIKKILGLIRPKTPLILERMDMQIALQDIKLLKGMSHETLMDVDKKTLGKTVSEKRKIFF